MSIGLWTLEGRWLCCYSRNCSVSVQLDRASRMLDL